MSQEKVRIPNRSVSGDGEVFKDRKKEKRKLSLVEIEHYMKLAKAIERTKEVQREVDEVFAKTM